MGKNDEALGRYFADNNRYADLINGFVLNGRQVIRAEDLSVMDSRTHGSRKSKNSKYRDLIRKAVFGANFAIIGVENQGEVNYIMPVRCMAYDAGEYERQVSERRKELQQKENLSAAEFMSGIRKEDKLHPCITFVLYYGDDWDGSKDLAGMLDISEIPIELQGFVNNYKIHVLDVKKLEMDEDAYEVAVAFTGAEELLAVKKKEGVNMCQALKELLQDERAEGREEGREEETLRMTVLIQKLLHAGRSADLLRATEDKEYLKKLCIEMQI